METRIGKIIGKVSDRKWAQVYDFFPGEPEDRQKRGRLAAIVSIELPDTDGQTGITELGREILARLHEAYYGERESTAWEAIGRAVDTVLTEFEGTEIAAAAIVGRTIYIAAGTGTGVWTSLGPDKDGWLVTPDHTDRMKAMSGRGEEGRVIVLGNKGFWDGVSLGMLRATLANQDQTVETLATAELGRENSEGQVGAVIRISEEPAQEREMTYESKSMSMSKTETGAGKEKFKFSWSFFKKRQMYIGNADTTGRRKKFVKIGLVVLAGLILIIGAGMWRKQVVGQTTGQASDEAEKIIFQYREATALVILDPVRSRQLLSEIKTQIVAWEQRKIKDKRIDEIKSEIPGVLEKAMGIKKVTMREVVDLGLVREGMQGTEIARSDTGLLVLDTNGARLATVDIKKNNGEIIAGRDNMGAATLLASYPGKAVVVSDKGITECGVTNSKCTVKVQKDGDWGSTTALKMFAGNIYLLDKTGKQIWRYQASDTGYGKKQKWLADTEDSSSSSLSLSTSMAIDGSVWILECEAVNSKCQITKYTRGVKDTFTLSGWNGDLNGSVIYTDDGAEKLYILDRTNGRVVVIKKTGEYVAQLESEQVKTATDMTVDEQNGKWYVISGSKIWEGDI